MNSQLLEKMSFLEFCSKQRELLRELHKEENRNAFVGFFLFLQETFDAMSKDPDFENIFNRSFDDKGNMIIDFGEYQIVEGENGTLRIKHK